MNKKLYNFIKIRGARVNNLKNVDLNIPLDKLVVVTGLSGSGKSSLVFDLVYAESQRRYVESLSSYARQFIGMMDKPDVDIIEGLIPAISIDQRSASNNPRSTVGTITEIYDYFRLLYAKLGEFTCPKCSASMEIKRYSKKSETAKLNCSKCSFSREPYKSIDFSFNASQGACQSCGGLGYKTEIDPDSVLNMKLTIAQGAIKPWLHYNFANQQKLSSEIEKFCKKHKIDTSKNLSAFSKKEIRLILNGDKNYEGILKGLDHRYQETDSSYIRQKIGQYMSIVKCSDCKGTRLNPQALSVYFRGYNIAQLSDMNMLDLYNFFNNIKLSSKESGANLVEESIKKEILVRLENINQVGLSYLSVSRSATSLSGGESQRLRLAHQISSNLVGLLYVLDEPSIGLHPKDNENLLLILRRLKDKGNSVIVVEHDDKTMLSSDYIIDIGKGAGSLGGELMFAGTVSELSECKNSLTADYLFGRKKVSTPAYYREGNGNSIKILGAKANNLKNVDVDIPLEKLVAVTGVSGSGKSTLIIDILAKALNKKFYKSKDNPGEHKSILGLEWINKVIDIDQSPIGRTPRSNLATYTGIFSYIREEFASLDVSKKKGYKASHFSFNLNTGRCDKCQGDGLIKIEMQFLPDIYVKCDACDGKRYKDEVLELKMNDKNIFDVLEMTVEEALSFFSYNKNLYNRLHVLKEIGLSYVKLGQSATSLSGGESQRIKLALELSRPSTGKTLYILDEPTTGLHFEDVKNLLKVLNALVDKGNTVLVIEHNLDIVKSADWVIDMGPEGGAGGGQIVFTGTPKELSKNKVSYSAKYLKNII